MRTIIACRVHPVVLLSSAATSALTLVASATLHLAACAGVAPEPARIAPALLGLAGWTFLALVVARPSRARSAGRVPPAVIAALVLLGAYFALNGAVLARPPAPGASPAMRAAEACAAWRVATAFAMAWLFALAHASLPAARHLHRQTLPRARRAAYAARRGQP